MRQCEGMWSMGKRIIRRPLTKVGGPAPDIKTIYNVSLPDEEFAGKKPGRTGENDG
jgi:hypothetical protein